MDTFNDLTKGKKIELLRRALGMNQTQFASRIGAHLLTIHKLENGKKTPIADEVMKSIEGEFNVNIDSIQLTYEPANGHID